MKGFQRIAAFLAAVILIIPSVTKADGYRNQNDISSVVPDYYNYLKNTDARFVSTFLENAQRHLIFANEWLQGTIPETDECDVPTTNIFMDGETEMTISSSFWIITIDKADFSVESVEMFFLLIDKETFSMSSFKRKCQAAIAALEFSESDEEELLQRNQNGESCPKNAFNVAYHIFTYEIYPAIKLASDNGKDSEQTLVYSGNYDYYYQKTSGDHFFIYTLTAKRRV